MIGARKTDGAKRNNALSVCVAWISSFKSNLTTSATVCNSPHGPVCIGPRRSCIHAIILRSARTRIVALVRTKPKKERNATMNCRKPQEKMIPPSSLKISSPSTIEKCIRQLLSIIDQLPVHLSKHNIQAAYNRHNITHFMAAQQLGQYLQIDKGRATQLGTPGIFTAITDKVDP